MTTHNITPAETTTVKGKTKKAKSSRKTTWSSEPELDESGNMEVIDIDTITWSAIDTAFFNTVAKMYPTLYANLCIHRTPSGGDQIQSLEQERISTISEMEAKEESISRTNKKGKKS
ncbi:MAG: hypothetical protein ABJC12_01745 [Saprospiraceae bacterium]